MRQDKSTDIEFIHASLSVPISGLSSVRAYSTSPHAYIPSGYILSYKLFEQKLKEMVYAFTMIRHDMIDYSNGVNKT